MNENVFAKTELNSILAVRAEKIRQRLLKERGGETATLSSSSDIANAKSLSVFAKENAMMRDHVEAGQMQTRSPSRIPVSKIVSKQYGSHTTALVVKDKKPIKSKSSSKRDAKTAYKNSTVNIKHYRPGYTWHMGGRVKELRIRCIARKFLHLWARKVFGRVLLSHASKHHDKVLVKRCFGLWCDYWWEIVKEWRLGVRAESYFRFKLCLQMFLCWKSFIATQRMLHDKFARADKRYENCTCAKVLKAWKLYIQVRHSKMSLQKRASQHRTESLVRIAWNIWQHQIQLKEKERKDDMMALQFWAYRLQAQHLLIWRSVWNAKKQQSQRLKDASVYHNSMIVSKCLHSWILYSKNRRRKSSHADFAKQVRHTNLRLSAFNHWFQRWHLRQSIQQHHLMIETYSALFRKRWVLWRWKQYVHSQRNEEALYVCAVQHHNTQLLRLGLDSFRLNVVYSHIKIMRQQMSQQFRTTQLQRHAWKLLIQAVDEREEQNMASKTALAVKHHMDRITRLCFHSLVKYATWREQRKQSYAMADAHFYLRTMPVYLFHMKIFVETERKCKENLINAETFRRMSVFGKVFHKWHQSANEKRDERLMERMALLHRESVLIQAKFNLWRQQTLEVQNISCMMGEAERHYLLKICSKAFGAWNLYIDQQKTQAINKEKALHHYIFSKVHKSFSKWRKITNEKKQQACLSSKAQHHHRTKVLNICFAQLKTLVSQRRFFQSLAEERRSIHVKRISRQVLVEWHMTAVREAANRRQDVAASVHFNRSLLQKVLQEWHRYAAMRAYRKSQTEQLLKDAMQQLDQIKLSLFWQKWQETMWMSMKENEKMKKAEHHHELQLCHKALGAWKAFTRSCIKKRLQVQQSKWYHDVNLTAKCYLMWKNRFSEAQVEHEKTDIALWQWSLVLQKKVLMAWQEYLHLRKQSRARMLVAGSMYRSNLVRGTCTQWLLTADSLSHMRSSLAAQHQAKTVVDTFNLAHRIALHWKIWARIRAAIRYQERADHKMKSLQNKDTDANMEVISYMYPPSVSNRRLLAAPASSQLPIFNQTYPTLAQNKETHMPRCKLPTAPSTQPISSSIPLRPQKAFASPTSLGRGKTANTLSSHVPLDHKQRPPPKRPAFLAESLKRAGLLSYSTESSQDASQPETAISERGSSPALSDLGSGNHFSYNSKNLPHHLDHLTSTDTDGPSLSAGVKSGSVSSLDAGDGTIKPLHLSNSEDTTGPSGGQSITDTNSTSQSPHPFTPSTQRSQFSGNPLLYSSPVSDNNTARDTKRSEATGRIFVVTEDCADPHTVEGGKINSYFHGDIQHMVAVNSDDGTGILLRGNLEGVGPGFYQQSKRQRQVQLDGSYSNVLGQHKVTLLKPEYFMKKPLTSTSNSDDKDYGYDGFKKSALKHTPRSFASQNTDPTSGLPPLVEWKSSSNFDSAGAETGKEGFSANQKHTPREHIQKGSPRRTVLQGILHKVSDSDGDVSPLNTARSRGTVTFASPISPCPEEELINIRDRLKHFHDQKQKLRFLQKQYRQLSECLTAQKISHQDEEYDSKNASEELNLLRLEVADLQGIVDSQRPVCERLVKRAKALAQDISRK